MVGNHFICLTMHGHKAGLKLSDFEPIDAGSADDMVAAFKGGEGDYVHLQGPAPQQLEIEGSGVVVGRRRRLGRPLCIFKPCISI